jgi:hypothetical protein
MAVCHTKFLSFLEKYIHGLVRVGGRELFGWVLGEIGEHVILANIVMESN